jgi:hypothetical protein
MRVKQRGGDFSSSFTEYMTYFKTSLRGFVDSDSLVAKTVFLLLIIFLFVIFLKMFIKLLIWLTSPVKSPHIINGMVDAKQMLIVPQDPSSSGALPLLRSVNSPTGIEFTWSIWIFIDDLQYQSGKYRHIFHKGNDKIDDTGLNSPNNAPGLYISPNTNELTLIMNTFNVVKEEVTIPNIPLNKWVNVIIKCKNTLLDVYINGTITKSVKLTGVPKQNYGNVYIAMNGGFSGYISNLYYFDYALGIGEIRNIIKAGPNTTMKGNSAMNMKNPDYLSLKWYFYGNGDEFNP